MSVIWSGITEEGAVVPVQVTAEGKVVAVGDGPEGDYLKLTGGNMTGDLTLGNGTDDKITLEATTGLGEFGGGVKVTGGSSEDNMIYGSSNWTGMGGNNRVVVYNDGSTNTGVNITADGLAPTGGPNGNRYGLQSYVTGNFGPGIRIQGNRNLLVEDLGNPDFYYAHTAYSNLAQPSGTGKYVGFYNGIKESQVPNGEVYAFYSDQAPSFFAGSTYIGGYTARNTFELWKSNLTEEQLEELTAGTLVAPTNVSLPGDGSFARQWYYDQQDAETQAELDAGTLEYPTHLAAATFTDTFDLGDNTKINLLSDGSAIFSDNVVIGSRGKQWLIRESNGVAMLVEQALLKQPREEKVRDLPNELDLIEAALNEIMDKLRMTPPAGWPVWDG